MTKQDRKERALQLAGEYVQVLRTMNQEAEKSGAPKLPESEYRALERELAKKLVRA